MKKKLTAWITAAAMGLSMLGTVVPQAALAASAAGSIQVEHLDRAFPPSTPVRGCWSAGVFSPTILTAPYSSCTGTTRWSTPAAPENPPAIWTKTAKARTNTRVDTLEGGKVISTADCTMISNQNYFQLNLDPPTGSGCTYSPNDLLRRRCRR